MKLRYFSDTDTAYLEFNTNEIFETKDINEDVLIDLDEQGNLVGMTIEHAKTKANLSEFAYQQVVDEENLVKAST
ncbi:MAG: DUF2283 domain-containing protein [bacterium]